MAPKPEEKTGIAEKDWLDLSWKHFQQHAQQRISYFNFFVIFSTILATGIVSTYQKSFGLTYLGVPLGLLQAFLAFMFLKLDERNTLLTKHAETTIKHIEATDKTAVEKKIQLFITEEQKFGEQKEADKKIEWYKRWYKMVPSHSTSYLIIYRVFLCWGIAAAILPFIGSRNNESGEHIEASIVLKYAKTDSLEREIAKGDSLTSQLFKNIEDLSAQVDTLLVHYRNYPGKSNK